MARRVSPIFLVFLFTSSTVLNLVLGTPRRLIRSAPSPNGSDVLLSGLIERVSQAEQACDPGSTVGSELLTCLFGFHGFVDDNFAADAQELLGCFDPYKRLLEGCTTFAGRDNDLAILDAVQVALENNAELIDEIQANRFGGDCLDRVEDERISKFLLQCYEDEGIIAMFDAINSPSGFVELAKNICGDLSSMKSCMIKGKNSDPCPEARTAIDFILSIYDKIEANAEHKDVMGRCLNGGGGGA